MNVCVAALPVLALFVLASSSAFAQESDNPTCAMGFKKEINCRSQTGESPNGATLHVCGSATFTPHLVNGQWDHMHCDVRLHARAAWEGGRMDDGNMEQSHSLFADFETNWMPEVPVIDFEAKGDGFVGGAHINFSDKGGASDSYMLLQGGSLRVSCGEKFDADAISPCR